MEKMNKAEGINAASDIAIVNSSFSLIGYINSFVFNWS